MKTCTDLVSQARALFGYRSDALLAAHIGYAQQTLAHARSGNMSDAIAVKIAALLKLDPGYVVSLARAERETNRETKTHLEAWLVRSVLGARSVRVQRPRPVVCLSSGQPAEHVQAVTPKRSLDGRQAHAEAAR